jgi:hypothetical protein
VLSRRHPLFLSKFLPTANKLERKKKGRRRRQNGTMIYYIFFGYFTLEYSSNIHLKRERPRRALARVVSARLSGKGGGEIVARKNLFFLHEKGTREFLDKEDESTDQYVFFPLSGVRVRSRREYKSLQT